MSLDIYVLSAYSSENIKIKTEEFEIVPILGKKEEAIAVKIDELFSTITNAISEKVTGKSELIIELNGSISLNAEVGGKFMFFNAGGGVEKSNSMKITFKTEIGK